VLDTSKTDPGTHSVRRIEQSVFIGFDQRRYNLKCGFPPSLVKVNWPQMNADEPIV
jgi:hypothetical protein